MRGVRAKWPGLRLRRGDFLPQGGDETTASFPWPSQLAHVLVNVQEVQGLRQGLGSCAQGRWERSQGAGGQGAGPRTQATSVIDMLCNRPCPSQGRTPLSTSQEGWLSWYYPTVFTEHPLGAEGLWGGQASKDFSKRSGTRQGTDTRERSRGRGWE